jgi:predicted AAA+ superfamily ATPase
VTELLDVLVTLNPWWSGKDFDTGIRRERYFSTIQRYLAAGEIVVLSGVRRSGKTTLLYQTIDDLITTEKTDPRKILFVNCDEPDISRLDHPLETVLETYQREISGEEGAYLVFDEIQNVEGWERWIKSMYDRKAFRIIISGSSSHLLDSQLSTLISGRYLPIHVYPLDFTEYLQFKGVSVEKDAVALSAEKFTLMRLLKAYLREGGFPGVVLQDDEATKKAQLEMYYDSIVYRDIILTNNIRNQKSLSDLLTYFFTNFTSPYSYRSLENVLGLDFATIKEYISYAEMAKILFEVHYFSYSLKAQSRHNRKMYCVDNGLRNAVSFRFSEDEGRLAENLVFIELKKRGYRPFYWKKGGEVDFVIRHTDDTLTAINVTYTDTIPGRECRGLREFSDEFGPRVKDLLIITRDTGKTEDGIRYVPLWKWLLGVE